MEKLRWFMNTLRRHFNCRDQYHHLEAYMKNAPPEVLEELDILRRKLEDLVTASEQNKKVTSRTINAALRRGH